MVFTNRVSYGSRNSQRWHCSKKHCLLRLLDNSEKKNIAVARKSIVALKDIKKGEVFTIVEEKNGLGKLKSGAGWISMGSKYVQKI